MTQKKPRDLLIRKIPAEVYDLLEQSARDHNRSKTQEVIVVLRDALAPPVRPIKRPKPFKWKTRVTNKFLHNAINEGQE